MLVELVAQTHCLYFLCTEAIKYVYTNANILQWNGHFHLVQLLIVTDTHSDNQNCPISNPFNADRDRSL